MTNCPLVKSHRKSSKSLPKLHGRTLATVLAFGFGVVMATSASWKVDSINARAMQLAAEQEAASAQMTSTEFDSTPFQIPLLADNN